MKITPIRIISNSLQTFGTGKYKGEEVFPTTITLLNQIGIPKETLDKLIVAQQKRLDTLPDIDIINNLREYQKEDVKFLAARKCAGCFNEQRTGKTPTALVTMRVKEVRKLLIVAPASTLYTWAEECKTWWYQDLPVSVVDGTAAKRKKIISSWTEGVLIISYECLRETQRTIKDELGNIIEIQLSGEQTNYKDKAIEGAVLILNMDIIYFFY